MTRRPRIASTKIKPPKINTGEESFLFWCKAMKLPVPARNFRFMRGRKFEIDFAWPELRIGIEIQGGVWSPGGGAHSRPANIIRDMVKHNLLLDRGWKVWHFTPSEVQSGAAIQRLDPIVRESMALVRSDQHEPCSPSVAVGRSALGPPYIPPSVTSQRTVDVTELPF